MNKRSRRKVLIAAIVFGVATATVLGLTAFEENLLYFYSPTQVKAGEAPTTHSFRVGGLVVDGSVKREPDSLKIEFDVTDNTESMTVEYTGILPDLSRWAAYRPAVSSSHRKCWPNMMRIICRQKLLQPWRHLASRSRKHRNTSIRVRPINTSVLN